MHFPLLWRRSRITLLLPLISVLTYCAVSSRAAPVPVPLPQSTSAAPSSTASAAASKPTANATQTGVSKLPEITVKQLLVKILDGIDADAADRFVLAQPIAQTGIGLSDSIQSNADIDSQVGPAFTSNDEKPSSDLWMDKYIDFLLEAGSKAGSLDEQFKIIDQYENATIAFAQSQSALTKAYYANFRTILTFIGVKLPDAPKVDAVNLRAMERWAATNATEAQFSKKDFDLYVQRNKTLNQITPKYQELTQSIQMASQGNLYKQLVYSQGLFNLSMIVGGDPESDNARYAPAWSATIVANSILNSSDIQQMQSNLNGDLGTPSNSSFATSINSEAPKSTSKPASSTVSKSNSTSLTSKAGSSSTVTSTTNSPKQSPTPGGKRGLSALEIVANSKHSNPHTGRGLSALEIVANSKHADRHTGRGLSVLEAVAQLKHNTRALNKTLKSSVETANNATKSSEPEDDPLEGVPETPPAGNIMLLSLQEGAWANQRDNFIEFTKKEHPDLVEKYFGKDNKGLGPIGRRWTHIVLLTVDKPKTNQLGSVQILGKVYDVLPSIKSGGSGTSKSNGSTKGSDK